MKKSRPSMHDDGLSFLYFVMILGSKNEIQIQIQITINRVENYYRTVFWHEKSLPTTPEIRTLT